MAIAMVRCVPLYTRKAVFFLSGEDKVLGRLGARSTLEL